MPTANARYPGARIKFPARVKAGDINPVRNGLFHDRLHFGYEAAREMQFGTAPSGVILLVMAETKSQKALDVSTRLAKRRGNGILRREVWVDGKGRVVRYNLAYINHDIFQGDNGRVVGYDNAHGVHHRHYKGRVETVDFQSFESIEDRFEADWTAFGRKGKK